MLTFIYLGGGGALRGEYRFSPLPPSWDTCHRRRRTASSFAMAPPSSFTMSYYLKSLIVFSAHEGLHSPPAEGLRPRQNHFPEERKEGNNFERQKIFIASLLQTEEAERSISAYLSFIRKCKHRIHIGCWDDRFGPFLPVFYVNLIS